MKKTKEAKDGSSAPAAPAAPSSKLEAAEAKLGNTEGKESDKDLINSSTHHKEYLRYKRWIKNGKRFPVVLGSRLTTEEGRNNLFVDYVKCGGNIDEIIARHEQSLTESQKSQVKYGFRSEKWLQDQYGDDKAKRIMAKKVSLGLTIADPEEPEDCLYFCLIDIDVKNINEFKKVTSLEAKGMISPEMLTAFTEAGGVMYPTKVKGDMSSQAGMTKALQFMNMPSSDGKSNNKSKSKKARGAKETTGDKDQVKAETPQDKAKSLITKVLKDANACRQGVSKMSLISSRRRESKKGTISHAAFEFFAISNQSSNIQKECQITKTLWVYIVPLLSAQGHGISPQALGDE